MDQIRFYVFYSNKCNYCYELCNLLEANNLLDKCKLICLEKEPEIFSKNGIKHVPVLITKFMKPVYGDDALNYIRNKKYYNQITNNIKDKNNVTAEKYNDPKIKSALADLEFNSKEATSLSDSYSNIDDIDIKKLLMDVNDMNKQIIDTKNIIETKMKATETSEKLNNELILRKKILLGRMKNMTTISK